jgi:hypothetical protein
MVFKGKYCLFNDITISQVNKATLQAYPHDCSTYLLPYVRKEDKVEGRDLHAPPDMPPS